MSEIPPNTNASLPSTRRWLQFSLRGLLLLTTAISLVLIYHARRHQAELEVLAQARVLDAQAEAQWMSLGVGVWPLIMGDHPAPIFDRIVTLTLHGENLEKDKVAELPLEQLPELLFLNLFDTVITDEEGEELEARWGNTVEVGFYNTNFSYGAGPPQGTIDDYLKNPTAITAKRARITAQSTEKAKCLLETRTLNSAISVACFKSFRIARFGRPKPLAGTGFGTLFAAGVALEFPLQENLPGGNFLLGSEPISPRSRRGILTTAGCELEAAEEEQITSQIELTLI